MRAIIHIGIEKTGTTALQLHLARNREGLVENGFLYPLSLGVDNAALIALYAMDPDRDATSDLWQWIDTQLDPAEWRRSVAESFRQEIAEHRDRIHTVLISSEFASSRLERPGEIRRLADLVREVCDEIRILVYLRRQVDVAVSLYSTSMRAGHVRADILDEDPLADPRFDYETLLQRWAAEFGDDALIVRAFDENMADITADFTAVCAIPAEAVAATGPVQTNRSLQPLAQEYLRRLNVHLPEEGKGDPARASLIQTLDELFAGPGRRPDRASAERFQACFDAANERVRRRWLPSRRHLFDRDFAAYPPEVEPRPTFGVEEAIQVTAAVWRAAYDKATVEKGWRDDLEREIARCGKRIRELEAQLALRDGRIAALKGQSDRSAAYFSRALEIDPGQQDARRRLDQLARHPWRTRMFRWLMGAYRSLRT